MSNGMSISIDDDDGNVAIDRMIEETIALDDLIGGG